jgi:hypothetical protein
MGRIKWKEQMTGWKCLTLGDELEMWEGDWYGHKRCLWLKGACCIPLTRHFPSAIAITLVIE